MLIVPGYISNGIVIYCHLICRLPFVINMMLNLATIILE